MKGGRGFQSCHKKCTSRSHPLKLSFVPSFSHHHRVRYVFGLIYDCTSLGISTTYRTGRQKIAHTHQPMEMESKFTHD